MIERGEFDAALAELAGSSDGEALYLMGRAWVGKAGGDQRTLTGSLGPEEMQALDLFQQAVAARPDLARAHLAIADLLAPYALAAQAAPSADPGTAVSVDRVLEALAAAVQADPADTAPVEAMIAFAIKADRKRAAAEGFRELTARDRENPDLLVRYGDFLAGPGEDPEGALGVYGQALIWRSDDQATHLKIADIHIDAALVHLESDAYAAAEARLREARKHVSGDSSPQARRLKDAEGELARASGRR
jgi:hypothetical protein